jgi:hypothetical protein
MAQLLDMQHSVVHVQPACLCFVNHKLAHMYQCMYGIQCTTCQGPQTQTVLQHLVLLPQRVMRYAVCKVLLEQQQAQQQPRQPSLSAQQPSQQPDHQQQQQHSGQAPNTVQSAPVTLMNGLKLELS